MFLYVILFAVIGSSYLSFCIVALHNLGVCVMDQGNFSEAIEMLREVMSIHDSLKTSPESKARTLARLLKSLNGDGKFEQAEQEYLTFLEKYNDVPPDSIDWKEVIKQYATKG
jgi:tetratricopeptide (TPR) repeat protein